MERGVHLPDAVPLRQVTRQRKQQKRYRLARLVFTLESGRTFDKLADDLRGNLTTYKGHPAASGTMMDWMKETHQAGIDTAYDGLSNGDDIAGVYIEHALPVVQQQLLKAGVRLAKIIDENF